MWGSFHCKEQNPLKPAQVERECVWDSWHFPAGQWGPTPQPQGGQGQGRLQGNHALVDSLRCPL